MEETVIWALTVPTVVGVAVTAKESCCPGCSVTGRTTELGVKTELFDPIEVIVVAVVPLADKTSGSELVSPVVMLPKARDGGFDANVLVGANPVPLIATESELGFPLLDTVNVPK